jgi:hypothetical protein
MSALWQSNQGRQACTRGDGPKGEAESPRIILIRSDAVATVVLALMAPTDHFSDFSSRRPLEAARRSSTWTCNRLAIN